jgi:hypothetical protein
MSAFWPQIVWSDGRSPNPSLRSSPVAKCTRCRNFFWLEEWTFPRAVELPVGLVTILNFPAFLALLVCAPLAFFGVVDPVIVKSLAFFVGGWFVALFGYLIIEIIVIGLLPRVPRQLDEKSYLEAGEAFGGERERQLRLAAWWAARDRANSPDPKNLERLIVLLGTDSRDRLLRAEALRSLGRHLETARELEQPFEDSLQPWADTIRAQSALGHTEPVMIKLSA